MTIPTHDNESHVIHEWTSAGEILNSPKCRKQDRIGRAGLRAPQLRKEMSTADVVHYPFTVPNPDSTTTLNWTAEISVVGAIAGLASRMMSGIIKKLSGSFFECIKEKIEESERMQA